MATATYFQRGEAIDYPNTGDETLKHGTVVSIKTRIGVVAGDIEPKQTGTLHVAGVFEIPKKDASAVFAIGDAVSFDDGIIAAATGKASAGYVVKASAAGEANVVVKLPG